MAVPKHSAINSPAKTHAEYFCESLSASQRNALRTILHHDHACADLKRALGIQKVAHHISEHARRTGKAMVGRTIELFQHNSAADLHAGD